MPERKRRLLLEAQAASALNDPRIVALYDVGSADGIDFLVMEYVEGQTLDKLIPPGGMEIRQALAYAVEIAAGLATAHEAGIVHRDLKPGNIMITGRGAVKVLDFGLAKLTEAPAARASGGAGSLVSIAGLILGTAAYMSPEQAQGQAVDARSDIFSFGVVLYEMLTGQRPFQGSDRTSTLAAIVQQEPKALTEVNPDLPAKLEQIVKRELEKDRNRRYQSAAEMLADLRAAPRKLRWRRRTRFTKLAALGTVAFLLVAATASWFYLRWHRSHQLTAQDTIVLADFANTTGDSIFDGTLRQGLAAQLEQSPFLSLLSDSRIAADTCADDPGQGRSAHAEAGTRGLSTHRQYGDDRRLDLKQGQPVHAGTTGGELSQWRLAGRGTSDGQRQGGRVAGPGRSGRQYAPEAGRIAGLRAEI